ncbi:MAG TPA: phosphopantetheine-binding protein, partial [Thermoanaerobaculia bacterium]|nr:phosphopantetheine-binding protein [Thermoanaerobaculia bacterium]
RLRSLAPGVRVAILTELPEVPVAAALLEVEEVPETAIRFPAGRPLAGCRLMALDPALEQRPDWVPGRLWVTGPGTGERLVDTGQLARWLPGGGIEVLGREEEHTLDVAGHPVDLSRVEAALERCPGVRAAVAGAWSSGGRRRLAAWIVPAAGAAPDPAGLAEWLSARLPGFMVPSAFVVLEELPLTSTGEVDRAALPPPPSPDRPAASTPPRDALEETLAGFCRELLGVERVGLGDDFFALGGDSFTAVRLLARVEEQWGPLDLSSFFLEPTVFHLAGLVRGPRAEQGES